MQPIDFYYMLAENPSQGVGSELTRRIAYYVRKHIAHTDSLELDVSYMDRGGLTANESTLFELLALLKQIRDIVGKGRPLQAADLLVPNESHGIIHASGIDPLVTVNAENRLLPVVQSPIPTDMSLQWTVGELLAARQDVIAIDYNQTNGSEPGILRICSVREFFSELINRRYWGSWYGGVVSNGTL